MSHGIESSFGANGKKPESAAEYTPDAHLIAELAGPLHLEEGASEQEVAKAFLESYEYSHTQPKGSEGDPIDLLPPHVSADAFLAWAEKISKQ